MTATRDMPPPTTIETTGYEIAPAGDAWQRVALRWDRVLAQKSDRTRDEYRRNMRHYLASIGGDPARATPGNVYDFAYGPGDSGRLPSASTVTVRLAAVRSFYDVARRERIMPENPADDVQRPRSRDPRPRGLDAAQLRALLEAIPPTPAGARDRAAILTAVLTGLRRSELLGLTRGSLREEHGRIFYTATTKGGRERRRELPAPAWQAIRAGLAALGTPVEQLPPDAPLFPIKPISFYDNLRRYAKRAGLEGVTPHVLRHSAAKLRRESGASIEDIGTFLGHRSLHTTSVYLRQLEGESDPGWHGVAAALGIDGEEMHS
jgi:integrase/recombinase XerD